MVGIKQLQSIEVTKSPHKLIMKKYALFSTSLLALPLLVSAQQINSITSAGDAIMNIINNVLVPLIFAVAFLVFIWGVFQYFIAKSEEAKENGKNLILYGLIGFFVMVSVWGLVNILVGTFSLNNAAPTLPTLN